MGEMKSDMAGAANVVGLMAAVAARSSPTSRCTASSRAAENMPDGNAYRPGDVFGSLDGKTVEIINTDAEGRLVLADALAYARTLEPDVLVDNATLTGACVVALGKIVLGLLRHERRASASQFGNAARRRGRADCGACRCSTTSKDQLKSDIADLKHTGDRWGGSITAALFLREFVGNTSNWIHCDIAGPALADRARGCDPKGGTGHGVLTFVSLIEASRARSWPSPSPSLRLWPERSPRTPTCCLPGLYAWATTVALPAASAQATLPVRVAALARSCVSRQGRLLWSRFPRTVMRWVSTPSWVLSRRLGALAPRRRSARCAGSGGGVRCGWLGALRLRLG